MNKVLIILFLCGAYEDNNIFAPASCIMVGEENDPEHFESTPVHDVPWMTMVEIKVEF